MAGRVDAQLAQVGVATVLVVGEDGDLEEEGAHWAVVKVTQGHLNPARRLRHLHLLDLHKVVEVTAHTDRDPGKKLKVCTDTFAHRKENTLHIITTT